MFAPTPIRDLVSWVLSVCASRYITTRSNPLPFVPLLFLLFCLHVTISYATICSCSWLTECSLPATCRPCVVIPASCVWFLPLFLSISSYLCFCVHLYPFVLRVYYVVPVYVPPFLLVPAFVLRSSAYSCSCGCGVLFRTCCSQTVFVQLLGCAWPLGLFGRGIVITGDGSRFYYVAIFPVSGSVHLFGVYV